MADRLNKNDRLNMRSLLSLAVFAAVILFSTSGSTFADDEDHFRKFKVPSDEAAFWP